MEVGLFGFATAIAALYLLPTVIAAARGHKSVGLLLCFNLGCGWMPWGYVAALMWAIAGEAYGRADEPESPSLELSTWDLDPDPDDGERMPEVRRRPVVRRVGRRHPARCAGLRRVG